MYTFVKIQLLDGSAYKFAVSSIDNVFYNLEYKSVTISFKDSSVPDLILKEGKDIGSALTVFEKF